MKTVVINKAQLREFLELYQQGVDAWVKAGEKLVELVEACPDVFDTLLEMDPRLNPHILQRFEALGRRMLHPQLLTDDTPGYRALSRLPFSAQKKYIEEPVPVLTCDEGQPDDHLLVNVRDLSPRQVKQVFNNGKLRTLAQQKVWLTEYRRREFDKYSLKQSQERPSWQIRGKKVEFSAHTVLSAREIAAILSQLT